MNNLGGRWQVTLSLFFKIYYMLHLTFKKLINLFGCAGSWLQYTGVNFLTKNRT